MSDVEIVARVERRRQWTAAEKAALLAEVAASNGGVVEVARRHRISPSLLYNWRSALKSAAELKFVPLGVLEDASPATQRLASLFAPDASPAAHTNMCAAGAIEIALTDGVRIRVDALVNEQALARVLRVMRGMA